VAHACFAKMPAPRLIQRGDHPTHRKSCDSYSSYGHDPPEAPHRKLRSDQGRRIDINPSPLNRLATGQRPRQRTLGRSIQRRMTSEPEATSTQVLNKLTVRHRDVMGRRLRHLDAD